jgi:chromosome partitioning protein
MARVIAVVGRKGGIGKTTVSVHLAGELAARGRRVHLVDSDPQGSAAQWAAPGNLGLPVEHLPVTVEQLKPWVERVRRVEAEVVILDCPPHLDAALGAAVGLADLAVLPCGPSGLDMMAMSEVLAVVRQARAHRAGKPTAMIVPNRVDRRTSEGREIVDELAKLGEPVGPALAYRSAFVRAFNTGDTVGAFAPGSAADVEVKALADAIEKAVK